jgi:hypothetical protein
VPGGDDRLLAAMPANEIEMTALREFVWDAHDPWLDTLHLDYYRVLFDSASRHPESLPGIFDIAIQFHQWGPYLDFEHRAFLCNQLSTMRRVIASTFDAAVDRLPDPSAVRACLPRTRTVHVNQLLNTPPGKSPVVR